ncbi:helix-turn-helix domain-containing protein [Halomarina oriensis]|uniref:Bacterio-opsin activator n=1 Tax=Halomarina oriensis TaxID=671145 RepID=A0A6B0GGJ8_9EURY|nr:helix-turn-helix domain-containing protein [Halomarina oriensis]MWG34016.1 bacterio-opsin activator [Halomarina oriensis]
MIQIVDITVPADAFELGALVERLPEVHVELERMIPLRDGIAPLFWAANGEREEIIETLESSPRTEEVRYLTEDGRRRLFEVQWSSEVDGLVGLLLEHDVRMLDGESIGEGWDFRLQFPSQDRLSAFQEDCKRDGIPVILRRMYDPHYPNDTNGMSSEQQEAIVAAYEHGYFEVPRRATLAELAERFDISDNAYSQRLRRGLASLVYETMVKA